MVYIYICSSCFFSRNPLLIKFDLLIYLQAMAVCSEGLQHLLQISSSRGTELVHTNQLEVCLSDSMKTREAALRWKRSTLWEQLERHDDCLQDLLWLRSHSVSHRKQVCRIGLFLILPTPFSSLVKQSQNSEYKFHLIRPLSAKQRWCARADTLDSRIWQLRWLALAARSLSLVDKARCAHDRKCGCKSTAERRLPMCECIPSLEHPLPSL